MFDRGTNRIEDLRIELNGFRQIMCLFWFYFSKQKFETQTVPVLSM